MNKRKKIEEEKKTNKNDETATKIKNKMKYMK